MLPSNYQWLMQEPGPKMLLEALKLYGTKEMAGGQNNPIIMSWAKEIGGWGAGFYDKDSIPWCGLFVAIIAKRAGKTIPKSYFSALEWKTFGVPVKQAMLGDVLVFKRDGGGHVGLYVGEDADAYHVLGGNQSDQVNVTRVLKSRCVAIRRPEYNQQPANVRKVELKATGAVSTNEQ